MAPPTSQVHGKRDAPAPLDSLMDYTQAVIKDAVRWFVRFADTAELPCPKTS